MSGDVQPRKRKDKKKKRDDEASHGVHITKMGTDDVLLHVQHDHGTGGHWCAKIIFFSLMAVLLGLVALIIMENRDSTDMDTPLSESRFSNYFDGWVEEHRQEHDDHDDHAAASAENHEDDDEHDEEHDDEHDDEPYEEVADVSEGEEELQDATEEQTGEDDADEEEEDEQEEEEILINDNDDDDENITEEKNSAQQSQNDEDEDDDEDNENVDENITAETSNVASNGNNNDNDSADNQEDEEDDEDFDDGTYESLENLVDNDAGEFELLQEKARQQAAAAAKNNPPSVEVNENAENADSMDDEISNQVPSWASSQIKPKSGPRASDDDFDVFEQELRRANEEMLRELYPQALQTYDMLIKTYPQRIQLHLAKARALDAYAEQQKSNQLLRAAIEVYKYYLQIDKKIANVKEYKAAAKRCLERMKFLGQHQDALPLHHELIKRFPQDLELRQQLTVTYLLINRFSEAKKVLEQLLQKWPDDGFALVHYGFVLKQYYLKYDKAVDYLQRGIASKAEGTQDGRFYFQLGDALQRLGREEEAFKVYKQGADLKLFPSIYQRSLYNEPGLKAQPFWSKNETGYQAFFHKLEQNWLAIKAEGLNILSKEGYFIDESENLKDQGDWKQFELYARGQQIYRNCLKAPITCSLIEEFPVARQCRRGQVKFSIMHEDTHVWPHCGPTNCRLRAHLGLVVPEGARSRLRVAEEESTWHEGKFLIFDDSFEHEVWHNGTGIRLVLIVDVWHPDLTLQKRRSLTAI